MRVFCRVFLSMWRFAGVALFSGCSALAVAGCLGPLTARAESPPPELLNQEERIFGLSLLWMEVHRNFPIRSRLARFDAAYLKAIERVAAEPDAARYYRELQLLLATLGDGHTFVRPPKGMRPARARPGMGLERIGDVAIVSWVRSDLTERIPLGSVVESIDGLAVGVAAELAAEAVSNATPQVRRDQSYRLALEGERGSAARVRLRTPAGESREIALIRGEAWPDGVTAAALAPEPAEALSFRWLQPSEIAYVDLRSFGSDAVYQRFREFLPQLATAQYVILDIRENGGGDSRVGYKLLSHFLDRAVLGSASAKVAYDPEALIGNARAVDGLDYLSYPSQEPGTIRRALAPDVIEPCLASERIRGRLLILTGHRTVSAAEDFLVAAASIPHLRIGAATAGSTGQPITIPLPAGGRAYILSKHDTFADGREFLGIGIAPDIEILPSVADAQQGIDAVLQRTLELIEQEKLPPPAARQK